MARKISVVTGGHGGMGKAIALELGKKTSVLLADMNEGQLDDIPAGRSGHPYEISSLIAYLVSERAAFLNGIDILQDGGQTAKTFVTQIGD